MEQTLPQIKQVTFAFQANGTLDLLNEGKLIISLNQKDFDTMKGLGLDETNREHVRVYLSRCKEINLSK